MNDKLNLAWKLLIKDKEEEKAFKIFLDIGENINLTNIIRAEGYRGAGETLLVFAPYLGEADTGYSYFKKAIELDKNNLYARVSLCFLFFIAEGNELVNEKEFLENILYLINTDLNQINRYNAEEKKTISDEIQKRIKSYLKSRLEKINMN